MDDQMTIVESNVPLLIETIPLKKLQISPQHDSSIIGRLITVDGQKYKCKEGRRKSGSKKHRAGKNQKRTYKPYFKLTYAEREKADERNEKRANRKREYLHSCGITLAPPNTTQFLVNDSIEGRLLEVSEKDWNSDNDDFDVIWKKERFNNMTQRDLIEMFMNLQDDIELAEDSRGRRELDELEKIRICEEEIKRCELENEELSKCNAKLAKILKDGPCKDEKDVDKKTQTLETDLSSVDIGSTVLHNF